MVMKGVQDFGSLEACLMAINAGVDMFIFRDADKQVYELICSLVKKAESDSELALKIIESDQRIQNLTAKI